MTMRIDRSNLQCSEAVSGCTNCFVGYEEAIVDLASAVHSFGHPGLAHQRSETVLANPGTDTAEHVFAAVLHEYHGIDTLQMRQPRKQQS
jgi:hypothetical protein